MVTYRVKNWDDHFENAESRKVKHPRWVAIPNRHDGKGYRRLSQHPEAVKLFCAWSLIVQVASKMPLRGTLADEDGALSPDDLASMTGFPAAIFALALKSLSDPKIGWIECLGTKGFPDDNRESPDAVRIEGKGRESREGKEEKDKAAAQLSGEPADAAPPEQAGCEPAAAVGKTHKGKSTGGTTPASEGDSAILRFPTVKGRRGGPSEWPLTRGLLDELHGCFPDLDVLIESRRALAWINASQARRKTADGMRRFLLGWMGRAQNRGSARGRTEPAASTDDDFGTDPKQITPETLTHFGDLDG